MSRKLISFDWALKRLLRSKANFEVLEGFLTELLKEDISILEVLESESNKDTKLDKFNRVDLKAKNSKQEHIIIEVQYERELDYIQRIMYATSKTIVEHLHEGQDYRSAVKVISVNILYFDLGNGQDYIYYGSTRFTGLHKHDELHLSQQQQALFKKQNPSDIFPEFYLIKVNQFNDIAKDNLDEWVYFLKNEEIREDFKAKGLKKAKEVLDMMKLSDIERAAYEQHIEDRRYQSSMYFSSFESGRYEGEKEGLEKGIEKGLEKGRYEGEKKRQQDIARLMKQEGEPYEKIARYTQLSIEEIKQL
jgi:predicted transposase/invertase (TIGR01784 family)